MRVLVVITKYSSPDAAAITVPIASSTTSESPQLTSETTTAAPNAGSTMATATGSSTSTPEETSSTASDATGTVRTSTTIQIDTTTVSQDTATTSHRAPSRHQEHWHSLQAQAPRPQVPLLVRLTRTLEVLMELLL